MKRQIAAFGVVALAGATLLAGCTSDVKNNPTDSPSPSATLGSSGTPTTTQRGVTIQDSDMGHMIQIVSILNDVPLSDQSAADYKGTIRGGSVVAVHVMATAGSKYFTYLYDTDFTMNCIGLDATLKPNTSNFADDLTAADMTPWVNPKSGNFEDGWMTYVVPGTKYPIGCSVTYDRKPQNTPSGLTLPEFTKTVQLN